ncbi:polysaccharide export protein [Rhodomicrobium sp. Az07]|nr:polysaccharide export protein [Rhodomicrobium sp. Az07]
MSLTGAPTAIDSAAAKKEEPSNGPSPKELAGSASIREATVAYSAMSDPKSKSYKVGPLDVLEIAVFKVPDLSKTVQVSEAGTINYPLVGEIQAGGRSAREIEQELTQLLGEKYLQKPQISVFVKEYNSQRVTVEGAVKKPGVVPMVGGLSLIQAMAQAGGSDESADSTVVVFRTTNGNRSAIRYDLADIRSGSAADPLLQSGDVVIVPTSNIKQGFNTFLKMLPLATVVSIL